MSAEDALGYAHNPHKQEPMGLAPDINLGLTERYPSPYTPDAQNFRYAQGTIF